MNAIEKVSTFAMCLLLAVVGLGIWGWVLNIITPIDTEYVGPVTGMQVARVVGVIIAPLGAVLGWID